MRSIDPASVSDIALVELTRSGVSEAYAELWRRHSSAVSAATRSFTGFDPDDLVQEAFMRVLQQIQAGKGPNTAFRAYAIMAARNIATNIARGGISSELTGVDDEVFEHVQAKVPGIESEVLGNTFTQQVFGSLPTRWQEVLWYREVEDLPVQDICTFLGMTENATSALLRRAREGFKQAWIASNLEPETGLSADCQWVVDKLPQLTRGKVSVATRRKLLAHFDTCARCTLLWEQSEHVHSSLAMALLPGVLGGVGAAGYIEWLQHGVSTTANATAFDSASAVSVTRAAQVVPARSLAGANLPKALTVSVAALSIGTLAISIVISASGSSDQLPIAPESAAPPTTTSRPPGTHGEVNQDTSESQQSGTASTAHREYLSNGVIGKESFGSEKRIPASPEVPPSPPIMATPELRYAPLQGSPKDGVEDGVFPRILGTSASNAVIHLTISNDQGQSYVGEANADREGSWAFTPKGLMGKVTIAAYQKYRRHGVERTDPGVTIGTFSVGRGLTISVKSASTERTEIRVQGPAEESKNQVVSIKSTTLGTLADREPLSDDGEFVIRVPKPVSEVGDLEYWQGDTSRGPMRVWSGMP
ncbi:RNA polymerase sigma factor (sigma-70 family) [Leucobacter luti]|uniref:sigma-70 family RNA polymerase sigma factor n=1 Tax=Leucobacter luti TaxID=340320 RepID=UPI001051976A|nr:sigma-70 family RNA polymerase sigma factor [Leucobacter luti]MCW2289023.1 RNA polymerase sigma factor (sigma-70 family) [Leucobacter luti]TCK44832.1 RNA polymerase sigma factor (sigma-70 family) [Leucobacter luti]